MKTSKQIGAGILCAVLSACSPGSYTQTVSELDLNRFMGTWYVLAYRPTFLEKGAFNAIEEYTFNEKKQRIDISYSFNKGGLSGPLKSIPQTAWVVNKDSNAHWKVSPFWPLRFDYLVVALDRDYQWTVIGVPNGNYLWLMTRHLEFSIEEVREILAQVNSSGYPAEDFQLVEHEGWRIDRKQKK